MKDQNTEKPKNKGGRPKVVFTEDIIQRIGQLALQGCQNKTIANILDIPNNTLIRRFSKFLMKKRSERRQLLRQYQLDLAKTNPAMAIFLGKNELGQTDKRVYANETPAKQLSDKEVQAVKDLARQYKLKLARGVG